MSVNLFISVVALLTFVAPVAFAEEVWRVRSEDAWATQCSRICATVQVQKTTYSDGRVTAELAVYYNALDGTALVDPPSFTRSIPSEAFVVANRRAMLKQRDVTITWLDGTVSVETLLVEVTTAPDKAKHRLVEQGKQARVRARGVVGGHPVSTTNASLTIRTTTARERMP